MFRDLMVLVACSMHLERCKQLFFDVVHIFPYFLKLETLLRAVESVFFFNIQEIQVFGSIVRSFCALILPVVVNKGVPHDGEEPSFQVGILAKLVTIC